MLYPEINKLRDAAGSRYFLVSMASKRARDLIDGSPKLDAAISTNKPVSIAAEEIAEGLFTYKTVEEIEAEEASEIDAVYNEEADEEETQEAEAGSNELNETSDAEI